MIVRQPIDVVVERMDASRRANAGLAHRTTEALLPAPDLIDEFAGAGDNSADRRAQSLREIDPGRIPSRCHIAREGGAHAALGGFQITPLPGADGKFSPDTFRGALHPRSRYQPPQTLVSVEQTANIGGGTIWNKADLDEVVQIARSGGLATHMDGARLLNACVASGISARDMAMGWDSAWLDFSKGLGAPVGAAIAGSRDFIDEVWRWKQRLGGSMRQAGICAAACVYALDHHVDRLADDHANARALARGLSQIAGIEVQQPETNLVFFNPDGAGVTGEKMVEALQERGVLLAMMDGRIRACTHLDVTAAMIEETVGLVRDIARSA